MTTANEINEMKKTITSYEFALNEARQRLQKANEQIKTQSGYYNQIEELKKELASRQAQNATEPIIPFLVKNGKNGFALDNYFKELFIAQQFKFSKKRVNITPLEFSLLNSILWKFKTNKTEISIFNTDFSLNGKGLYPISFNVDSSLMSNNSIEYYNRKLDCNIPQNTLTEEERQQLEGADRQIIEIER
jgi:hypothetical protein